VHDLSQRKTKANLQGWVSEVASQGRFSAPLPNGYTGPLPVPCLVIGNKSDIAPIGSSSNLVDAARQWVEKQGLLSSSDELPTTNKFPSGRDLHAVRCHLTTLHDYLCLQHSELLSKADAI
jgi:Rab-like protein 3